MALPLKPYEGPLRKLVLAMDVGTTFSGISYAILDPKESPKIQGVTRFPGQENGDFKIPSVLWYTQDAKVRAAGAEARDPRMVLAAEDEDLVLVEWFKLHLRPDAADTGGPPVAYLKALPPNKTAVEVFGDFLAYLFACARQYIIDTYPGGASLWSSFGERIEIVLSHPNGWEGAQQGKMRDAAVYANLVPNTPYGRSRIHFVTEGEASLLYCINRGLANDVLNEGATVVIVDAGGGTVDLTTYKFNSIAPISVEEIAPADCIFQGSIFVNVRAHAFLKEKLRNSTFGNDLDLQAMVENFEKATKPTFSDPLERSFIKFGSNRDRDLSVGIRSGQLTLEGADVAQCFQPSIAAIIDSIRTQRLSASKPVNIAFLVGGFAASPWLFAQLKTALEPLGMSISRPDNHTNKAVADGAVHFFLGNFVAARIARLTYGVVCLTRFDEENPEHVARVHQICIRPSGRRSLPNAFKSLLDKVPDGKEIRRALTREATSPESLDHVATSITCYRGRNKSPSWTDLDPSTFLAQSLRFHIPSLCTVRADTSNVLKTRKYGLNGPYYSQDYDVVLLCGLTELKAQIAWIENGQERRGDAQVVYDDDDEVV